MGGQRGQFELYLSFDYKSLEHPETVFFFSSHYFFFSMKGDYLVFILFYLCIKSPLLLTPPFSVIVM